MDGMKAPGVTKMNYHVFVMHTSQHAAPILLTPNASLDLSWCPDCHKFVHNDIFNDHVDSLHENPNDVFTIAKKNWRYIEVPESIRKQIYANRGIPWN